MKKLLLTLSAISLGIASNAQTTLQIFDEVLFYDGYATVVSEPVPDGVIRHRNDLYATKLSDAQLASIGTTLTMNVTIKASCDNYDRIGNVNLALVPKGATTYDPTTVPRIEIGRFITPFMNKNIMPDTVPYTYNIDNVAHLLKETSITSEYDIWAELEVFGVPYAANVEVAGCAGRNDVFFGSMQLVTDETPAPAQNTNVLMPLYFKADFNNYAEGATDEIGETVKTLSFDVEESLADAVLFLITSNHGANAGGEEYNRRNHFVYFDGDEVLKYKPGRTSCEPFRVYNTQGNGIYSGSPRSDAMWQSFSNWCPGDVIDTRVIELGALSAGSHTFKIEVPDAVFADGQGYIPLSLYLQGKTSGTVLDAADIVKLDKKVTLFPNPGTDKLNIGLDEPINEVVIYNLLGQKVLTSTAQQIDIAQLVSGIYSVQIRFKDTSAVTRKFVKK